ncbi:hypothetical protein Lal_00032263 [Lupinus albus]|nr:hypothetical protein Lal_00032263 [Lupinus albus]
MRDSRFVLSDDAILNPPSFSKLLSTANRKGRKPYPSSSSFIFHDDFSSSIPYSSSTEPLLFHSGSGEGIRVPACICLRASSSGNVALLESAPAAEPITRVITFPTSSLLKDFLYLEISAIKIVNSSVKLKVCLRID